MTPTPFICPNWVCGKRLQAAMSAAGKRAVCHKCGTTFRLKQESAADGSVSLIATEPEFPAATQSGPSTPSPSVTSLPTAIGRFRILAVVGNGAFGVVYRAHDPELDREVAIKVPKAGTLTTPVRVKRFLGDAKAAARLRHPHIVPVFDVGEHADSWFIASAFVDGRTLADATAAELSVEARVDIVRRLAEALDYAHGQGVIHRDVKPQNVMLDASGLPHLIDFGLAKLGVEDDGGKRAVMGTAPYMSPEQAAGRSHEADAKSDQYSLGVTLYELLCGRPPFLGPTSVVLYHAVHTEPPPLRSQDANIPLDLSLICQRAMMKNPAERYASCREFADDLRRWLDGETPRVRVLNRWERFHRWVWKEPKLARAVGLAIAAIVIAAMLGVTFGVTSAAQARELAVANGRLKVSQEDADKERDRARDNEIVAQRALASAHYDRATDLCERGEIAQGVIWFVKAIEQAEAAGDADLEYAARQSLTAWMFEHHALERVIPLGFRPVAVTTLSPDTAVVVGAEHGVGSIAVIDHLSNEVNPVRVTEGPPISAVTARPGGEWFVTADARGMVRAWTPEGKPIGSGCALPAQVLALAVHPTKPQILAGCRDGRARLLNWTDWPDGPRFSLSEISYPHAHGFAVYSVAFHPHPDTPLILTGSGILPEKPMTARHIGEVRQINMETGDADVIPQEAIVRGVTYHPDGLHYCFVTGSLYMGEGRVCDARSHQTIQGGVLEHIAEANAVAYSPNGRVVVTAGQDHAIQAWDAITFRRLGQPMRHSLDVRSVAIVGDVVLAVGDEHAVRVWRLASGPQEENPDQVAGGLMTTAHSPINGSAWSNTYGPSERGWPEVKLQRRAPGSSLENLKLPQEVVQFPVWAIDSVGDVVACGSGFETNGYLNLYSAKGLIRPVQPPLLNSAVYAVGVSPNGSEVAFGCEDGTVGVWSLVKNQVVWKKKVVHTDRVYAATFSPDGAVLLTCSRDHTARMFDAASGQSVIPEPIELPNVGLSATFTTDGRQFLIGYGGGCRVFRWGGPQSAPPQVRADLPHQAGIMFVSVDPSGQTAVTGGTDRRVRWWDLQTGKPIGPVWKVPGLVRAAEFMGVDRVFVADTTFRSGAYREFLVPSAAREGVETLRGWVESKTGIRIENDVAEVVPVDEWAVGPATVTQRAIQTWWKCKPIPQVPIPQRLELSTPLVQSGSPQEKTPAAPTPAQPTVASSPSPSPNPVSPNTPNPTPIEPKQPNPTTPNPPPPAKPKSGADAIEGLRLGAAFLTNPFKAVEHLFGGK